MKININDKKYLIANILLAFLLLSCTQKKKENESRFVSAQDSVKNNTSAPVSEKNAADTVSANKEFGGFKINLNQYRNDQNYFIRTFDVDKDGMDDKIVSHQRYQGEELLIFLGTGNDHYRFVLAATNFSEDGGNQISKIEETAEGFQIITQFPDRGHLQKSYFVKVNNEDFILNKVETESSSWQNGFTENCVKYPDVSLKRTKDEISNAVSEAENTCKKTYSETTES